MSGLVWAPAGVRSRLYGRVGAAFRVWNVRHGSGVFSAREVLYAECSDVGEAPSRPPVVRGSRDQPDDGGAA